jgi:hypothetical protein
MNHKSLVSLLLLVPQKRKLQKQFSLPVKMLTYYSESFKIPNELNWFSERIALILAEVNEN